MTSSSTTHPFFFHTISPSDSLISISFKYNVETAILRKWNHLHSSSDSIFSRQYLIVPLIAFNDYFTSSKHNPALPRFTQSHTHTLPSPPQSPIASDMDSNSVGNMSSPYHHSSIDQECCWSKHLPLVSPSAYTAEKTHCRNDPFSLRIDSIDTEIAMAKKAWNRTVSNECSYLLTPCASPCPHPNLIALNSNNPSKLDIYQNARQWALSLLSISSSSIVSPEISYRKFNFRDKNSEFELYTLSNQHKRSES